MVRQTDGRSDHESNIRPAFPLTDAVKDTMPAPVPLPKTSRVLDSHGYIPRRFSLAAMGILKMMV